MTTKTIRILGLLLPGLLWLFITALRIYLAPWLSPVADATLEVAVVTAAGSLFAGWIALRFEQHDRETNQRAAQLESLRQAAIALTTEVDLPDVLQKVVEQSKELSNARYAALGVLDARSGQIAHLYTAGLTPEQRARMGPIPQGHGMLGVILAERRPIRIDTIDADPRHAGSPPQHPHMTSLLGVPIMSKGAIFGNLYLTDKVNPGGGTPVPFTETDQRTLEMYAAHAAVAIENARLHSQAQELAIMQERERFGMNLHDGVIQSIYAVGLMLDDAAHRVHGEPELAQGRIDSAVKGLDEVIRDIRNYISDLRPERFEGRGLYVALHELVAQTVQQAELAVDLHVDAKTAAAASAQQASELLHVVQEALTNIQKHAGATLVTLGLRREGEFMLVEIVDNGKGFDVFHTASHASGQGLRNMQERARALNGELEINSEKGHGTRLLFSVPLPLRSLAAA